MEPPQRRRALKSLTARASCSSTFQVLSPAEEKEASPVISARLTKEISYATTSDHELLFRSNLQQLTESTTVWSSTLGINAAGKCRTYYRDRFCTSSLLGPLPVARAIVAQPFPVADLLQKLQLQFHSFRRESTPATDHHVGTVLHLQLVSRARSERYCRERMRSES